MTSDAIAAPTLNRARFLLSAHLPSQLPPPGPPEIAFAGRSNVGKSSLINRLTGRKSLVKTSGKPGKTRSLNFFAVDESLYLVDLPGYGFAQVSREARRHWGPLIEGYIQSRETLALVIVICDLRHEAKAQDMELLTWLRHLGRDILVVYTKADKLSRNEQTRHAAILDAGLNLAPHERLLFSAHSGQGREALLERILAAARPAIPQVPPA